MAPIALFTQNGTTFNSGVSGVSPILPTGTVIDTSQLAAVLAAADIANVVLEAGDTTGIPGGTEFTFSPNQPEAASTVGGISYGSPYASVYTGTY